MKPTVREKEPFQRTSRINRNKMKIFKHIGRYRTDQPSFVALDDRTGIDNNSFSSANFLFLSISPHLFLICST